MHRAAWAAVVLVLFSIAAFAQPNVSVDSPYQVRYAANLNIADSYVNITNTGARGASSTSIGTGASTTGAICVNVYTSSPDEQLVSCCSCPVTPNGLKWLSVKGDLISNTLTPAVPTAVVIKLLASVPVGGSCANSAAAPGALTSGMLAWGSTLHPRITVTKNSWGGTVTSTIYDTVETAFSPATLSAGELEKLTTLCTNIVSNGSGFGICRSCRLGGR